MDLPIKTLTNHEGKKSAGISVFDVTMNPLLGQGDWTVQRVRFCRLEDARTAQSLNGKFDIAGRIIKDN
ncbi:hypothetical protein C5167_050578 [Papaver somniferum]|uniref:Uncharacterized protein n=1 Tax=Papaver somniferum TaxID=3469 RepID=A0A4Y7KSG6_PAPSO|nr:hypothetical protein C5167_050578 [Papaver somniferum]